VRLLAALALAVLPAAPVYTRLMTAPQLRQALGPR